MKIQPPFAFRRKQLVGTGTTIFQVLVNRLGTYSRYSLPHLSGFAGHVYVTKKDGKVIGGGIGR